MSETEGGIVINGAIANKALESLRKFAASSRNGKIGIGGKLETVLHLIIGLKDKGLKVEPGKAAILSTVIFLLFLFL